MTGGFAFADSFTINLTNNSKQVLNVCQEVISGEAKADASNPCDIYYSGATLVTSVEGGKEGQITVSNNNNLMFFCNSTPITSINFSKDDPAGQCDSKFGGWSTACGAYSFSCSAAGNDIDVTLN